MGTSKIHAYLDFRVRRGLKMIPTQISQYKNSGHQLSNNMSK